MRLPGKRYVAFDADWTITLRFLVDFVQQRHHCRRFHPLIWVSRNTAVLLSRMAEEKRTHLAACLTHIHSMVVPVVVYGQWYGRDALVDSSESCLSPEIFDPATHQQQKEGLHYARLYILLISLYKNAKNIQQRVFASGHPPNY
jgi:hypothetical protein